MKSEHNKKTDSSFDWRDSEDTQASTDRPNFFRTKAAMKDFSLSEMTRAKETAAGIVIKITLENKTTPSTPFYQFILAVTLQWGKYLENYMQMEIGKKNLFLRFNLDPSILKY